MKLFPYQELGARWLAERSRAYLADPPGLGKTVQAIHAWNLLQPERVLVLCPKSAVHVWKQHAVKMGSTADLRVLTYDSLRTPRRLQDAQDFDAQLVVCDEAHRIRNPKAKRSVAAFKLLHDSPRVWWLSGTPMPNHPGELYTAAAILWPELLQQFNCRRYVNWVDRWCQTVPTEWGYKVLGGKNLSTLRSLLFDEGRMLRREVADVAPELPPFLWDNVEVEGEPYALNEVREEERRQAESILAWHREGHFGDTALATLRRLIGTAKAGAVAEMVKEEMDLGVYKKIVIFAHHQEVLNGLHQALLEYGVVRVDGASSVSARVLAERSFQESPFVRVFLGQSHACGEAITLTSAHHVLLVEPDWTPDVNFQAAKRCHRIGQHHPVFVRMVWLDGSRLEEAIADTIIGKKALQADVGMH